MRTPWKLLYDLITPILALDVFPGAYRLLGPVVGLIVFIPLVLLVRIVGVVSERMSPGSDFAQYLSQHFWTPVVVLAVLFFFYFFFRLVWDGLKESNTVCQEEVDD